MKKFLLFLIASIFLINLVSAYDVAYIVKSSANSNVLNALNELNMSYEIISDSQIPTKNFSNYSFLLIQDDVTNRNYLNISSRNSLFIDGDVVQYAWNESTTLTGTSSTFTSKFENLGTALTEGFSSSTFNAYTATKAITYLKIKPSYITKVATTTGSSGPYGIVAYSNVSNIRKVFFGFKDISSWSGDSKKLFKNCLNWVAYGEEPAFTGNIGTITWNESYGINNAINLNDHFKSWQGRNLTFEVYNKSDSHIEVTIVDGLVSFNSSKYWSGNGSIIFSATDSTGLKVFSNNISLVILPVNHIPTFSGIIPDVTWNEDSAARNAINLSSYFSDIDNDSLEYGAITSENKNITAWREGEFISFSSDENWNGNDWIILFAYDPSGMNATSNKIILTVLPVNDAPVMNNISDVSIVEGDKLEINAEVSDPDGDVLVVSYNSPLDQNGKWQTKLGDAGVYATGVSATDSSGLSDSKSFSINVIPKIYINEFSSDWVELYNPSTSASLDGCILATRNSSLAISGSIAKIRSFNISVDKDDDELTLVCSNLTVDLVNYASLNLPNGESRGRVIDGSETWMIYQYPSRDLSNSEDMTPPQVDLTLENDYYSETGRVNLSFNASDNVKTSLDCSLYLNSTLVMAKTIIGEGSFSLELGDGNYSWNVECSDGRTIGKSETRNFRVHIPRAPVVENLLDRVINETDLARIEVNAVSQEGLNLTYSINDSRFIQTGNIFTWQTDYDSEGVYDLTISVSDGKFNVDKTFKLTVLNRNRQPILEEIDNQTIIEDNNKSILLEASDADKDLLNFSIINKDTSKVDCKLSGNNLTIIPALHWYGNASCTIQVSDGHLVDSKLLNVEVLFFNYKPIMSSINNITANEGERVRIIASASDVEGEVLTYSINDSRFVKQFNNIFNWNTTYGDAGVHYFNVSVSDGEKEASQIVKVTVNKVNQAPTISVLNQNILEDSLVNYIEINASDPDGTIAGFKILNEDSKKVHCFINNSKLGIVPYKDFNGVSNCTIQVSDDLGKTASSIFSVIVNAVNDAPEIVSYNPAFDPVISKKGKLNVSVSVKDIDTSVSNLSLNWLVNGEHVANGTSYLFKNFTGGNYNLTFVVSDGEFKSARQWNIGVIGRPLQGNFTGTSTNFSNLTDEEMQSLNLILEKETGKISFIQKVDISDISDFEHYTFFKKGFISLDSGVLYSLKNKNVILNFYNVTFVKMPTVYYSQAFTSNPDEVTEVCPSNICSNITYNNATKTLSMNVLGFSSYKIGDIQTCSAKGGRLCSDSEECSGGFMEAFEDQCCAGTCVEKAPAFTKIDKCENLSSKIKLDIKDPDKNDKFKIGDNLSVSLSVENNDNDDHDFDVYTYLYDLKNDDIVQDYSDSLSVDEDEKEKLNLDFIVSNDAEDGSHAIFVRVEDDDYCQQGYVKIKLEKEDHEVKLKNVQTDDNIYSCGSYIEFDLTGENTGKDSENVYLRAENSELGIDDKTESFELEEDGGRSRFDKLMSLNIPTNAKAGTYTIKFSANYEDGEDVFEKQIVLGECLREKEEISTQSKVKLQQGTEKKVTKKSFWDSLDFSSLRLLNFALVFGIGILIILIILIVRRKR